MPAEQHYVAVAGFVLVVVTAVPLLLYAVVAETLGWLRDRREQRREERAAAQPRHPSRCRVLSDEDVEEAIEAHRWVFDDDPVLSRVLATLEDEFRRLDPHRGGEVR